MSRRNNLSLSNFPRRSRGLVTSSISRAVLPRNVRIPRAPMQLRAMGSTMTNGDIDPVPVNTSIKLQHRIQMVFQTPSTANTPIEVTNGAITAQIPGHSGFAGFRIMKIDAWGNDTASLTVGISAPGNDHATFTDWGSPGARRSALHIVPSFDVRSLWQNIDSSGVINQFFVQSSGVTTPCIVNLTLELQSLTVVPPQ